jgi:hypothetical protein
MFALGAPRNFRGGIALLPSDRVYFLMEEWRGNRSEAYWEYLVQNAKDNAIALLYKGNQHHLNFLLAREPLFDFVDPFVHEIVGEVLVPRLLLKAFFHRSLIHLEQLLAQLSVAGCRNVLLVGTPPPPFISPNEVESYTRIVKSMPLTKILAEKAGTTLDTLSLTPSPILLKMWNVMQELLSEIASRSGVRFVPVLSDLRDSRGYLLPTLHMPRDFTHANADYGRCMLDLILKILTTESEQAESSKHERTSIQVGT